MKQVLMNGTVITPKNIDPEAMKQQAKQAADKILEEEGIKVIGVDSIGDISETTNFSGDPVYEVSIWYNIEDFKPELGDFPHNTRQGEGVVFWIHFLEDGKKIDFKKEKVKASLKTLLKVANINGENQMKSKKRTPARKLTKKVLQAKRVQAKQYTENEWKYAEKMRSGNTKVSADEAGNVSIQLYDTVVAIVSPAGEVTLNTGGHMTPTTKRKMNQVLQIAGINGQVFQKNGHWYVEVNGAKEDFEEGMTVRASKKVKAQEEGKTYESIVFMQGEEADEVLDILEEQGEEAAMDFLMQWDMGEGGEEYDTPPWGEADKLYEKGDYVMSYNTGLPAFGLTRIVEGSIEDELDATKSGNVVVKDKEGNPMKKNDKGEWVKAKKKVKAQGRKDVGFAINVYLMEDPEGKELDDTANWDEVNKDVAEVESRALKYLEKFGTPRDEGHDGYGALIGTLFFDGEVPEEIQESMDTDEPLRTSSGTLSAIELLEGLAYADYLGVDIEFFEGMEIEEEAPAAPVMAKKKTKATLKKLHAKKKVKAQGKADVGFAINVDIDGDAPEGTDWDAVGNDIAEVEKRSLKYLEKYGTPRDEGHSDDELIGTLFLEGEIPEEIQNILDGDEPLRTSSGTLSNIDLLNGLTYADILGVTIDFFDGAPEVVGEAPASPVMAKKKRKAKKKVKAAAKENQLREYNGSFYVLTDDPEFTLEDAEDFFSNEDYENYIESEFIELDEAVASSYGYDSSFTFHRKSSFAKASRKKVKAAEGKAPFQFYYNPDEAVEMSGKGLTSAYSEEGIGEDTVDRVLEGMFSAIGEDIPEFHDYEISLYVEGGYGGYTFKTDYSNDNEPPDEILEKIWQWLADNTSIDPEKTSEPSEDNKNLGVQPASKKRKAKKKVKAQDDENKITPPMEETMEEPEEEGPSPDGEMDITNNSKFTDEELAPTVREILSAEGSDLDTSVTIEDIWWADTGFELQFDGMEFYVIPHADAEEAAKKYLNNDAEELVYTVNDWVIADNFDDEAFFRDIEDDEIESNIEWIQDDEPDLDYDQAREKAEEYWNDKVRDMTALDYLSEIYSEGDARKQMRTTFSNYIDIDGIAESVLDADGIGHVLAGYDGDEKEVSDYFYYRWN